MSIGKTDAVKAVLELMEAHSVTMDDLELFDFVSANDDLTVSAEEAFIALSESDFVMDSGDSTHYWQATAEYVDDALRKIGLVETGEWRVVIAPVDNSEEYLYELAADNRESAVQQAYESAIEDGLKRDALWTAKTVEAI